MIISHKYRLIFITTPKSGSHTGFTLMLNYFNAQEVSFNHRKIKPNTLNNYHSFSFVRNPYERFCALYHACVINDTKPFVPKSAKRDILSYAKWYAGMAKCNQYPREDLTSSQSHWHRDTKINEFIQIETAQEEFNKLYPELNIVMPHELKRKHPAWKDVRTPELIKYVNIWSQKDFELYGYECENSNS